MEKIKINATIQWAFFSKVNEMSGKFQVDLTNLSKAAVAALKEMGIEVKTKEDDPAKGYYITCKSAKPMRVFLDTGEKLSEDIQVANGSKATVVVGYYEWTFKNKKGRSPSAEKIVITELLEYGGSDNAVFDAEMNDSIDDIL